MHKDMTRLFFVLTVVSTAISTSARADEPAVWTSGHGDLGIAYEAGAWVLHVHAEGAVIGGVEYEGVEFEADEVHILVPEFMTASRPKGAQWDPVGVATGAPFWFLSQTEVVGAPYVGIGTEEIALGDFLNDVVTLTLTAVVSPSGDGHFSIYQTDLFGQPTFFASSLDGLDATDTMTLIANDHFHANLAFSEPGLWAITFEASGEHLDDGFVSGAGTYYFQVMPEPATAGLLMLAGLPAMRRRRVDASRRSATFCGGAFR